MRDGFLAPKFLVDVKHLDGTNAIRFDPLVGLTIGAGVNMNRVIASPESAAISSLAGRSLPLGGQLPAAYVCLRRR